MHTHAHPHPTPLPLSCEALPTMLAPRFSSASALNALPTSCVECEDRQGEQERQRRTVLITYGQYTRNAHPRDQGRESASMRTHTHTHALMYVLARGFVWCGRGAASTKASSVNGEGLPNDGSACVHTVRGFSTVGGRCWLKAKFSATPRNVAITTGLLKMATAMDSPKPRL